MFWKRSARTPTKQFDRAEKRPVVRVSICTGERTAGFQNVKTGRLEEVMLLRSEQDKQAFLSEYGIKQEELKIIY